MMMHPHLSPRPRSASSADQKRMKPLHMKTVSLLASYRYRSLSSFFAVLCGVFVVLNIFVTIETRVRCEWIGLPCSQNAVIALTISKTNTTASTRLRHSRSQSSCSPPSAAWSQLDPHMTWSIKNHTVELLQPAPLVLPEAHESLCDATQTQTSQWEYCLPISGRKDEPFCSHPDRMDLLRNTTDPSICYASILHMLLVDVYKELQAADASPLLLYGSLLGAVRNKTIIPFTEDTDIGYVRMYPSSFESFQDRLRTRGYHIFRHHIWRVCVAPTHPLAFRLFDPSKSVLSTELTPYTVPYVDLYAMERVTWRYWYVDGAADYRRIPDDKMQPFSKIPLNGQDYDTVADPIDFLTHEYGDDFMIPQPRPEEI